MNKHTPGPWAVNYNERIKTAFVVDATGAIITYKVAGDGDVDADALLANAALIAVAPEMADALLAAIAIFNAMGIDENHRIAGEQYSIIQNAINKANV